MKLDRAYLVFNMRTGELVTSRSTRKSAQRLADRLDLEYGAINFAVRQNDKSKQEVR